MSGEIFILYVITPAIIIITALFAIAAIILIKNNILATKKVSEKQDEIFTLNQHINVKLTNIEDVISNKIAPSIVYIKTEVEELTFKPSIDIITKALNELGINTVSITESGQTIAFGTVSHISDFKIGYIVHYIKEAEIVLFQSVSKQLSMQTIPDKALSYLMTINSQMLVGNVFVEDIPTSYPIVCSYSFKANKSNFEKYFIEEIIKRLASTHILVNDSLLKIGITAPNIDLNNYLELQNKKYESNKANQDDANSRFAD